MGITLIPVKPIGHHLSLAFVDGPRLHGIQTVLDNEFPQSSRGEALRKHRLNREIGLRRASEMLGIKASELSGLELGRFD